LVGQGVDLEILLTVKELAQALKLTEQTIQRYVLRKEIPFHKIMRAVRFRPSEINEWIDKGGLKGCADDGSLNDVGVLQLDTKKIEETL